MTNHDELRKYIEEFGGTNSAIILAILDENARLRAENDSLNAEAEKYACEDILALNNKCAAQDAEIERLREALGWFLDDDRFHVAVGGNPNVVEKMLTAASKLHGEAG